MNIYNKQILDCHYFKIYEQNKGKLLEGGIGDEFLISPDSDTRMSLSLLIRIDKKISEDILKFMDEIKLLEPHLYFYPQEDFHITVIDILKGIPNRKIPDNLESYIRCIRECADQIEPFGIRFRGITASDNAVLVKGYYEYGLEQLRQLLRTSFADHNLLCEERYKTISSHITVVRIPDQLTDPMKFIRWIKKDQEFGQMNVGSLELVFHNWYDSKKTVLKHFDLCPQL